jgi:hypothetical protein
MLNMAVLHRIITSIFYRTGDLMSRSYIVTGFENPVNINNAIHKIFEELIWTIHGGSNVYNFDNLPQPFFPLL